ncbi:MAG: hypothetical protein K0Q97_1166 [Bacillota bacterium]|jgi:hypothetical protein|nr:hypothetical protein [Bacillota bacterium]
MNKSFKKLVYSEHKKLIVLLLIMIVALILSALIYALLDQKNIIAIDYKNIGQLNLSSLFFNILKRNILYFIILIALTIIGQSVFINSLFGFFSLYYGISVLYLFKIMETDKLYLVLTFLDYFIFFPLLFYFTFISSSISKYTKKTKKIETISHKFDIIISSYMEFSLIYLLIIAAYSFGYSCYIKILSELLVR